MTNGPDQSETLAFVFFDTPEGEQYLYVRCTAGRRLPLRAYHGTLPRLGSVLIHRARWSEAGALTRLETAVGTFDAKGESHQATWTYINGSTVPGRTVFGAYRVLEFVDYVVIDDGPSTRPIGLPRPEGF